MSTRTDRAALFKALESADKARQLAVEVASATASASAAATASALPLPLPLPHHCICHCHCTAAASSYVSPGGARSGRLPLLR